MRVIPARYTPWHSEVRRNLAMSAMVDPCMGRCVNTTSRVSTMNLTSVGSPSSGPMTSAASASGLRRPETATSSPVLSSTSPDQWHLTIASSNTLETVASPAKLGLYGRNGLACGGHHAKATTDERRERITLIGIEVQIGAPKLGQNAPCLGAQVNTEGARAQLDWRTIRSL